MLITCQNDYCALSPQVQWYENELDGPHLGLEKEKGLYESLVGAIPIRVELTRDTGSLHLQILQA